MQQEIYAKENIHGFQILLAIDQYFLVDLLVFAQKHIKTLIIHIYFLAK